MQSALDLYLKSEVVSLAAAYQRLLEWHYSYQDAEGVRRISAPGEHPTEIQFRRYVSKHVTFEVKVRSRKGEAEFELKHRPKLGNLRHATYTVGEYYEIDATIADPYIVHSEARCKIIGKPVIYMIWDRKSDLCVGLYVGLENASWLAAMHAIKFITEDKAALCARYSVPYDPNDWPEALPTEPASREALRDECADVLLYLLLIAHSAGIDLAAAARAKLAKNAEKYPVDKAFGSRAKYSEQE